MGPLGSLDSFHHSESRVQGLDALLGGAFGFRGLCADTRVFRQHKFIFWIDGMHLKLLGFRCYVPLGVEGFRRVQQAVTPNAKPQAQTS